MNGYVLICSKEWEALGGTGQQYPFCTGVLQSVPVNELNSSGLSTEDWAEYRAEVILLFAVVFSCLAIKKAIF